VVVALSNGSGGLCPGSPDWVDGANCWPGSLQPGHRSAVVAKGLPIIGRQDQRFVTATVTEDVDIGDSHRLANGRRGR